MSKQGNGVSRRRMLRLTAGLSGLAITDGAGVIFAQAARPTPTRILSIDAKPEPIAIDAAKTAVIVVDMQNDFGAEGGMFHRAGIDISMIQAAVAPRGLAGSVVVYQKPGSKAPAADAAIVCFTQFHAYQDKET